MRFKKTVAVATASIAMLGFTAPAHAAGGNKVLLTSNSHIDVNFGLKNGAWYNLRPGVRMTSKSSPTVKMYLPNRCTADIKSSEAKFGAQRIYGVGSDVSLPFKSGPTYTVTVKC